MTSDFSGSGRPSHPPRPGARAKMLAAFAALAGATLAIPPLSADNRTDGGYLHEVTASYETPHLEWGKPLHGGAIKLLAITPRRYGAREVVELAQRFEIEPTVFVTATQGKLANETVYEAAVKGTSAYEKSRELMAKLEADYDVILLGNFDFGQLPAEAQFKILEKVKAGTGLVVTYPRRFPYPKVLATAVPDAKSIATRINFDTLPEEAGKVPPQKQLQTYAFGEGRVALLGYSPGSRRLGLTAFEPYTPEGWKARYENGMALAGDIVQWAAGRDPGAAVKLTPVWPQEGIGAGDAATIHLEAAGLEGGTLLWRVRDLWNTVKGGQEVAIQAGSASKALEIGIPALPAGVYYLDLRLKREGKVVTCGVSRFEVKNPSGDVRLATGKISFERGEAVPVTVISEKPLAEDAEIRLRLEDLPHRNVWARQSVSLDKGAKQATTRLSDPRVPTVAGALVCELWAGGRPVAKVEKVIYFPRREIELFPTILWNSVPDSLSEMYAGQLMTGNHDPAGLTHPGERGESARIAALFNQRFVPYMTRIGLKAGENGETRSSYWLGMSKERVEAATQGDGSFYNPAVKAFWKENIEHRIMGLPEVGPMIYTLGDENHFSYEAGYSPADEPAFREFLKEEYGGIDALNREWNTQYESFDAVAHPKLQEMREKDLFPQWYAHRRFMEKQYADVHHYLAECIREIDPHALVGAEGSVPGDLERTFSHLDFWGPYRDPVRDELLRSIAGDKLRTIWWGYGGEKLAYPLWKPLLQGVANGNAWYSASIEAVSGMMASDFTLAAFFRNEKKPYIDALYRGPAQLLVTTPLKNHGIAMLWSHASYSASFMNERFVKPSDSLNPLMQYCYRTGLNFDLVTTGMVEKGALSKYKILFLCGASALAEPERREIETFVSRGGIVVADLNPGILNASCRPLEKSSVGGLFGAPGLNWKPELKMEAVDVRRRVKGKEIVFKAEKAFQSPEVPVFSLRQSGEGVAILLNFNLSSAANTASGATPLDGLLGDLLSLAGIAPAVQVDGASPEQLMVRVRASQENDVVGLLASPADIGRSVTLRLPKAGWIYEADKGLIGQAAEVAATLEPPFKVYTVFPAQQQPPSLRLSGAKTTCGSGVILDMKNLDPAAVYRLEVAGPDGEALSRFTKVFTVAKPGDAREIRFAFSDHPGEYQVTLTDVRTNLSGTAGISLQPAP